MSGKKCGICGKAMLQEAYSEMEICTECDEEFHLEESEYGLENEPMAG